MDFFTVLILSFEDRARVRILSFPLPTFFGETSLGYPADLAATDWAGLNLGDFLAQLARFDQDNGIQLSVVAHSMGNRALLTALLSSASVGSSSGKPMFKHAILAAPDIDADVFKRQYHLFVRASESVTLYSSATDGALAVAQSVYAFPRAGGSTPPLIVAGVDTIDVSEASTDFLNHSTYVNARSVLSDLYYVVREDLPAERRANLERRSVNDATYWRLIDRP